MEDSKSDFHISFFKPTTEYARKNRNMVIWLVCVWAVAIFGFQIALYILEKPTPEDSFLKYDATWSQVKSGEATVSEMQDFSYAALSVLGKVFIQPQHKTALDNALSWSVFQIADSSQQAMIMAEIVNFETLAANITDIRDEAYQQSKLKLIAMVSPILGLSETDVRTKILPLELVSASVNSLSDEDIMLIEEAMPLYLIHNQSVLTDTKFLGFPFHYFYTAVFLLILFVVFCLIYCVRTDRINTRLNIVD